MAPRKKTTAKKAKLPVPKPKPRTITPSKSIVRAVTTKKPTTGTSLVTTKPKSKKVSGKVGKVTASKKGQQAAKAVTTKKPNTGSSVSKTESKTKSRPSAQRVSKFTADQKRSTMKTSSNMGKLDNLLKRVREFANNGDNKKAQKALRASIGSDLKKADSKIVKVARTAGLTKIPTNVATTLFQGLSRRGIIGLGASAILIGSAIYANKDDKEKIVKKANALEKKPAPEKKKEEAPKPKKETTPEPEKKKERTVISDSDGREDAKEKNVTPKLKPLEQGKRKIGDIIVDSTDKGMSKFSGFDNQEELEAEEEMNFRRGGTPTSSRTYGAREGGFTKRGGMYKKGY